MTRRKNSVGAADTTHFFVKELAGEDPPSIETLQMLYGLSIEFFRPQPWKVLRDNQLILARIPRSGEIAHCSVMGALGEVFQLHAYLGDEGYRCV